MGSSYTTGPVDRPSRGTAGPANFQVVPNSRQVSRIDEDRGLPLFPDQLPEGRRAAETCRGKARYYSCVDDDSKAIRWMGCGRNQCEHEGCQRAAKRRRGKRVHFRLGELEDVAWGQVMLTLPAELWTAARSRRTLGQLARLAWAVTAAWLARWAFHGRTSALGGAVCSHPARDASGPDVWSPHFHVLVPLRGLLDDGATVDGRWKVPKLALDDLRERWTAALRPWGWAGGGEVRVHYAPKVNPEQRAVAASYCARPFPLWLPWTQTIRYCGILRRGLGLDGIERPPWPFNQRWTGRCEVCGGRMILVAEGDSVQGWDSWGEHGHVRSTSPPW